MRRLPHAAALIVLSVPTLGALSACADDTEPVGEASSPAPSSTSVTPTSTAPPTTTDVPPSPSLPPPSSPLPSETSTAPPSPTATSAPTEEPPAPTGPSTYADAKARIDAATGEYVQAGRFHTPTDLYCVLAHEVIPASCELPGESGIEAPDVCGDGPTSAVGRIERQGDGFAPVCNTDTIREPGARTLAPGTVTAKAGIECLVETDGIVCVAPGSGTGFSLTSEGYQVF